MPNKYLNFLHVKIKNVNDSKLAHFFFSSVLNQAFFLTFIVAFLYFPSYDVALTLGEHDDNWKAIFKQADSPFTNHIYDEASHASKLTFRFVPAVIFKILHIQSIEFALIFQFLTLLLFYFLLINVLNSFFEKSKSFYFALPICFVVAGHVYCSDYRGIFDTLALDFLLLGLYFRNKWLVLVPLLLAYYTDERALIASSAIFLFNLFDDKSIEVEQKSFFLDSNIKLFASWICYFIIRFFLVKFLGFDTQTGGLVPYLNYHGTFYAIYTGLEFFIIPFGMVVYSLFNKKSYLFCLFLFGSYFLVFFAAQSVIDVGRSLSYLILILILLLVLLNHLYSKRVVERILFAIIIGNLLFFTGAYPFFAQVYRIYFMNG